MKIALLEDDLAFAEMLQEWLIEANFEVDHFKTGLDFLRHFSNTQYDLCIFDWTLPDMEGPDVMVSIKLRSAKLPPVIFLTVNSEESDIMRVMDSGADDFMTKPPSRPVLMARINALIRRSQTTTQPELVFDYGILKLDTKQRAVFLEEVEVKLTDKEFDLAAYFLKNEGILLSHPHLMQVVWGSSAEIEARKLDVHVSHLRTELKLTPEFGWKLSSIYQQGYRLERNQI